MLCTLIQLVMSLIDVKPYHDVTLVEGRQLRVK